MNYPSLPVPPLPRFKPTCLFLIVLLASPGRMPAQNPVNAPVPTQIASAHTIFLANAGAEANFPFDPTQAYNSIYAALQSWGRNQLAGSPADADLIFNLREVAPTTLYDTYHGRAISYLSPAYRVTIVDPKTQVTLWRIDSPVQLKGRGKVLAGWETLSVEKLISRLKVLDHEPLSPVETADLTRVPNYHFGRNAAIFTGAFVGAGVAGGLILHHEFENSLANQKAQQDAFCEAHNIPLSMCAGG
jgi:hypothetical protein